MKASENIPVISFYLEDGVQIQVSKVSLKDAWGICDFVNANESRLSTFFPKTLADNLTPDLANRFVELKTKEFENNLEYLFTVKTNQSRKIIGLLYIKELDWKKKQGEFAYAIDYNFEGKGITSKMVSSLSEYAFGNLDLETLQIIVHKTNIPSVKVAEKTGFQRIKTLKESFIPPHGKAMDMELYELYKKKSND